MGPGLLVALTLPGLVLLLVAVAVVEQLAARLGRRSPLARRRRHPLSAGGLDVFSAALAPGRSADLEQQRVRELRRDDAAAGDPIDRAKGVVHL